MRDNFVESRARAYGERNLIDIWRAVEIGHVKEEECAWNSCRFR